MIFVQHSGIKPNAFFRCQNTSFPPLCCFCGRNLCQSCLCVFKKPRHAFTSIIHRSLLFHYNLPTTGPHHAWENICFQIKGVYGHGSDFCLNSLSVWDQNSSSSSLAKRLFLSFVPQTENNPPNLGTSGCACRFSHQGRCETRLLGMVPYQYFSPGK